VDQNRQTVIPKQPMRSRHHRFKRTQNDYGGGGGGGGGYHDRLARNFEKCNWSLHYGGGYYGHAPVPDQSRQTIELDFNCKIIIEVQYFLLWLFEATAHEFGLLS